MNRTLQNHRISEHVLVAIYKQKNWDILETRGEGEREGDENTREKQKKHASNKEF